MPHRILASVLSAGVLLALGTAPPASAAVECFGLAATIVGTAEAEVIDGTESADVIVGLGGNDVIRGLGGDDSICGGDDDDVLRGGEGHDELAGESHRAPQREPEFPVGDVLAGGPGDDVVEGGSADGGDDLRGDVVSFERSPSGIVADLTAGTSTGEGTDEIGGVDALIGSQHDDTLRGLRTGEVRAGPGEDRLVTVPGREWLKGGTGSDVLVLGSNDQGWGQGDDDVLRMRPVGNGIAHGDAGDDRFVGGAGEDTFFDFYTAGGDTARGHGGSDVMDLGQGDDRAYGGDGRDVLFGSPGDDRVDGGAEADTFSGGSSPGPVMVDLRRGVATGAHLGSERLFSMENIDGTSYADVLIGDGGVNVFFAGPGNDRMVGGAGADDLEGHDGRDEAVGGPGSDRCRAETREGCES